MPSSVKYSNRGDGIGLSIASFLGKILVNCVVSFLRLIKRFFITTLWFVAAYITYNLHSSHWHFWVLMVLAVACFLFEPLHKFRIIRGDIERRGKTNNTSNQAINLYTLLTSAQLLNPVENEGDIKTIRKVIDTLPVSFEEDEEGNFAITVTQPLSYSVDNDIEQLTKSAVVNHTANSLYATVIKDAREGYTIVYARSIDPTIAEGNKVLRSLKLVKEDSARVYNAYMVDASGDRHFAIFDTIGYTTPRDIAMKVDTLKESYEAYYTEVKQFNVDEYSKMFLNSLMATTQLDEKALSEGYEVAFVKNVEKEVLQANELFKSMGINTRTNGMFPAVLKEGEEEDVIILDRPIDGLNNTMLKNKAFEHREKLGAISVKVVNDNGKVLVKFIKKSVLDDRKYGFRDYKIEPPMLDAATMTVTCAFNEDGGNEKLSFKGVSGMVIGGLPGSGKTAGATSFLLPLAMSDDVELTVIDCKGGGDWESYANASDIFISGADTMEDLEKIEQVLKDAVEDMSNRVKTNREILENSNFWNASLIARRLNDRKFKLIVVDECQSLFETKGVAKELVAIMGSIEASIKTLIKKGRSAGVCVVLMTQKPTSDAMPTAIRDNCAKRICFRVSTSFMAAAILGDGIDMAGGSPTNIPDNRLGGAVIADETGALKMVRFYYTPEERQEELLNGVSNEATAVQPNIPPVAPTQAEIDLTPKKIARRSIGL